MNFNELSQIIDAYHKFTHTNPQSSFSDNTSEQSSKNKQKGSTKNESPRARRRRTKRAQ